MKREITEVVRDGVTRFEVEADPSQRLFNTRQEAQLQADMLHLADGNNRTVARG